MAYANPINPKVYSLTVNSGYGWQSFDLHGKTAVSLHLTNFGSSDIIVRLNNDDEATFTLDNGTAIHFHRGDAHITAVEFNLGQSGDTDSRVEGIAGVVG